MNPALAKKLVPQTNRELNPEVQQYGCIWSCLKGIAQIYANFFMTPAQLNYEWELDKKRKNLTRVNGYWLCLIDLHHKIIEQGYASLTGQALQASIVDIQTYDRADLVGPSRKYGWWNGLRDATINCYLTKAGGTHFRLGDAYGVDIYDPSPGLPVVKQIQTISYKINCDNCKEEAK